MHLEIYLFLVLYFHLFCFVLFLSFILLFANFKVKCLIRLELGNKAAVLDILRLSFF